MAFGVCNSRAFGGEAEKVEEPGEFTQPQMPAGNSFAWHG